MKFKFCLTLALALVGAGRALGATIMPAGATEVRAPEATSAPSLINAAGPATPVEALESFSPIEAAVPAPEDAASEVSGQSTRGLPEPERLERNAARIDQIARQIMDEKKPEPLAAAGAESAVFSRSNLTASRPFSRQAAAPRASSRSAVLNSSGKSSLNTFATILGVGALLALILSEGGNMQFFPIVAGAIAGVFASARIKSTRSLAIAATAASGYLAYAIQAAVAFHRGSDPAVPIILHILFGALAGGFFGQLTGRFLGRLPYLNRHPRAAYWVSILAGLFSALVFGVATLFSVFTT